MKMVSPLYRAVGMLPKAPKLPTPTPAPTRDDAAAAIEAEDELRRRRGGAADILNGSSGVEPAMPGGKQTLGA
ncbi:hypothetical protein [Rhizorhabdus sp.]|uniref:hypothetical protein n=1 Tax=Rhizorhabdus sp. TaxID=1968843 RepID=UPI0035B3E815